MIPGRIDVMFPTASSGLPLIQNGKLRGLAVTTLKRQEWARELPTVAESGLPGFEVTSWYTLFAPAKTPPEIVTKISADAARIAREPDAALVPEIAARKVPDSNVAGQGQRPDFPRSECRQHRQQTGAARRQGECLRPNLLGLDRPAADVSRGSNAHDILGVAAIVGAAIDRIQPALSRKQATSCQANESRINEHHHAARLFIAATRQNDGKTTTSLGLLAALAKIHPRVGYIKPVGQRFVEIEEQKIDEDTVLMDSVYSLNCPAGGHEPDRRRAGFHAQISPILQ